MSGKRTIFLTERGLTLAASEQKLTVHRTYSHERIERVKEKKKEEKTLLRCTGFSGTPRAPVEFFGPRASSGYQRCGPPEPKAEGCCGRGDNG